MGKRPPASSSSRSSQIAKSLKPSSNRETNPRDAARHSTLLVRSGRATLAPCAVAPCAVAPCAVAPCAVAPCAVAPCAVALRSRYMGCWSRRQCPTAAIARARRLAETCTRAARASRAARVARQSRVSAPARMSARAWRPSLGFFLLPRSAVVGALALAGRGRRRGVRGGLSAHCRTGGSACRRRSGPGLRGG
jgi:hypothetical protein